ncbi:MAG: hypothetical protein MUF37_03415 [Methanoregulaceae archaeon]|jgi:hypothetical protein|nr:hypothetical protein [Methanoregulaceae archaeon]
MGRYSGIPELLEQFMNEHETDERWITVHELRDRFNLTRYQCNTVSGFLRRLKFGTFGRFQFIVVTIERVHGANPSDPKNCRYLVKRKSWLLQKNSLNEKME